MLDLINQMRRTREVSMDRDKRTTRQEPKVTPFESIRGKWGTLRRGGKLCKEWQDFKVFYEWFQKQPPIGNRFFVITADPRLPAGTLCGPDTAMILSKGLYEYISEYKLNQSGDLPVGVRVIVKGECRYLTFTTPGGSRTGGRYKDAHECQQGWLAARLKFVERYYHEHKDSPDVLELIRHFENGLRYHIEHKLEYKIGNWRDQ